MVSSFCKISYYINKEHIHRNIDYTLYTLEPPGTTTNKNWNHSQENSQESHTNTRVCTCSIFTAGAYWLHLN